MGDFYREVIARLVRSRVLDPSAHVLVLCAGSSDRTVLREHGFRNVVISNVTTPSRRDAEPFACSCQDAEHLTYPDGFFDFCIVHNGLHHCRSPHRALLEMYRVARRGLVLFEPYDNLTTRMGVKLHIGQDYEHASVAFNHHHHGGVANSDIPNFVYRFTEREIVKTINSFAPYARHDIRFLHTMRVPWTQLRGRRHRHLLRLIQLARPALSLMGACFPKQGNNFAAVVLKPALPRGLHPWLRQDGDRIHVDPGWLSTRYAGNP
jgi:SAM-dependent methyltransferase